MTKYRLLHPETLLQVKEELLMLGHDVSTETAQASIEQLRNNNWQPVGDLTDSVFQALTNLLFNPGNVRPVGDVFKWVSMESLLKRLEERFQGQGLDDE